MQIQFSQRSFPLVRKVDVAITGGSVAAVTAACQACSRGASVLILAPRPYLGEDLCSTLRLHREFFEELPSGIHEELLREGSTTPLKVKKHLEETCMNLGIEVLLGCMPVGVVNDGAGNRAGLVIANRAGRQVVAAKLIIDATQHGLLQQGSAQRKSEKQQVVVSRWVIGGEKSECAPVSTVVDPVTRDGHKLEYHAYRMGFEIDVDSVADWMHCEQVAKDRSYRHGQLRSSEVLLRRNEHDINGLERLSWSCTYRHALVVGTRSAHLAKASEHSMIPLTQELSGQEESADFKLFERLNGLRPSDHVTEKVCNAGEEMRVLADVDVVVVGGGTSGAAAGIAAARSGKSVLVLEYQECAGGVGTIGLIAKPYAGRDVGFAREVPFKSKGDSVEEKMEWLRRELTKRGGSLWTSTLTWGVVKKMGVVCGVCAATPYGHGVVLAKKVIDATGNADLAAAAGARVMFGSDEKDIATQGAGLSTRPLGVDYKNSDYLLVDDSDVVDVSAALLGSRRAVEVDSCYDTLPFIQSRERQRIVGEHVISYADQLLCRTFPDSIVLSSSDYDSHGYPSHPIFNFLPHNEETRVQNHPAPSAVPYTPYRSLIPLGIEGMLVIGLGTSMHRDASAMVRMQRDLLNQGYAAGLAASQAIDERVGVRDIDIKVLQRKLVHMGGLPESVLLDQDSFPLDRDRVMKSVENFDDLSRSFDARSRDLAVIFTHFADAMPHLLKKKRSVPVLLLLGYAGESSVFEDLAEVCQSAEFDAKIMQGSMAEYAHLPTPVDALILSLSRCGDPRALEVILGKLSELESSTTLSHHRSVAMALEHLADPRACLSIMEFLDEEGMCGHEMLSVEALYDKPVALRRREASLREITWARCLFRCGDPKGRAMSILEAYRKDVRGHLSRHATAVLASRPDRHVSSVGAPQPLSAALAL